MLYYETIDRSTLELLKKIQSTSVFSELRLVGGTALALQLDHRKSVDLDLFGAITTDEIEITKKLQNLGQITILKKNKQYFYI